MKKSTQLLLMTTLALITFSFAESPAAPVDFTPKSCISKHLELGGAYLLFAGKMGGEVTKQQIEGQCELQVEGCAKGSRIFSFTLAITSKGETQSHSSKSNALTSDMIADLEALQPGDTFEFKKTKAFLPNGKDVVDVHSRTFVVV